MQRATIYFGQGQFNKCGICGEMIDPANVHKLEACAALRLAEAMDRLTAALEKQHAG